jgi:hypothetical protein
LAVLIHQLDPDLGSKTESSLNASLAGPVVDQLELPQSGTVGTAGSGTIVLVGRNFGRTDDDIDSVTVGTSDSVPNVTTAKSIL